MPLRLQIMPVNRRPVTLDPLRSQRDGVRHLNLMEFLKEDGELFALD